jgi:hypothetical protein
MNQPTSALFLDRVKAEQFAIERHGNVNPLYRPYLPPKSFENVYNEETAIAVQAGQEELEERQALINPLLNEEKN